MRKAAVTLAGIIRPPPPEWNLTKFAKAMGVTRGAARAWIDGESVPTADKMQLMAKLFPGVPMADWVIEATKKGPKDARQPKRKSRRAE